MPHATNRLSDVAIRAKKLKPGLYPDGGGLYLQVKNGGRSWLLRFMIDGKARSMGLGRQSDISLAEARDLAQQNRAMTAKGVDPIEERRKRKDEARVEAAKAMTFETAADRFIKSKQAEWRNEKHAMQWIATLKTYAYPVLGKLSVQSIDTGLVLKVLEPIWATKTETATRVRQRIESVLNWASAHGHRKGENPARWRGHLDKALATPKKVRKVQHFKAMPHAEIPQFFSELRTRQTVSARALAFTILTAVRSGETRLAQYEEIDFDESIWTIPADRTKANREHRVPLTKEMLAIIGRGEGLIFPNLNGDALSDAAMLKYLQEDLKRPGVTVHGFRSTFKDWCRDRTQIAKEISEAALGHVIGDKTEAAYARSDVLDRRRHLMELWTTYCVAGTAPTGEVIPLRA